MTARVGPARGMPPPIGPRRTAPSPRQPVAPMHSGSLHSGSLHGGPAPPRKAPIGYRGPPSGRPAANLAAADSGLIQHNLYIKVVPANDPDKMSSRLTLEALRFIHERLPIFKKMGLNVTVFRVTPAHLTNARVKAAMVARGITRLPAIVTPVNTYLGLKEISDLYARNIAEFEAANRRGDKAVEGAVLDEEDDLAKFYSSEMTLEAAEEDAQETGIGENDDMMESYRGMMERRDQAESKRRPGGAAGRPAAAAPSERQSPAAARQTAAPPRSTRPDNVGRHPPADDNDSDLIDQLTQDIDDNLRSAAMQGGGGDSYEDGEGEGNSAQDDLMERAWLANHLPQD